MTRNLYLTIENRLSWDCPLDLWRREDTIAELVFWITNVRSLNIRKLLEHLPPRLLGYSDASDKACRAFMVSCDNIDMQYLVKCGHLMKKSWVLHAWRELKAIYYALLSFLPLLKGQNVHWHSVQMTKAPFRLCSLEVLKSIYKNWLFMFFLFVYIITSPYVLMDPHKS